MAFSVHLKYYPNTNYTLSGTTVTGVRSFSTFERYETYRRDTNRENTLNSLALINIHCGIILTTDEVLNINLLRNPVE